MSATAVPIPPTSKSALAKYWVGIFIIVAAGAALAWFGTRDVWNKYKSNDYYLSEMASEQNIKATKTGLLFKEIKAGEGDAPKDEQIAIVELEGQLRDGTVFQPKGIVPMPVTGGAIEGFTEALKKMKKGGFYHFWIPPEIGFGAEDQTDPRTGQVGLPGNSVLYFEATLQDLMSREQFEKVMKEQQAAAEEARKNAPAGGPPGGPRGAPPRGGQELPPEIRAQLEQQMRQQQGR